MISLTTVCLLCLISIYHAIEVKVSQVQFTSRTIYRTQKVNKFIHSCRSIRNNSNFLYKEYHYTKMNRAYLFMPA